MPNLEKTKPTYHPGTRVEVFDASLFVNDVDTPLSHTMRPATVVRWYVKREPTNRLQWLVDVRFDHQPEKVSHGHFTDRMKLLASQ